MILIITGFTFISFPLFAVRDNAALIKDVDKAIAGVDKVEKAIDAKVWVWTDKANGKGKLQSGEVEGFISSGGAVTQQIDDAIAMYANVLGNLSGAGAPGVIDPAISKKIAAAITLKGELQGFLPYIMTATNAEIKDAIVEAIAKKEKAVK